MQIFYGPIPMFQKSSGRLPWVGCSAQTLSARGSASAGLIKTARPLKNLSSRGKMISHRYDLENRFIWMVL